MVASLGNKNALILRNHGLLVAAASLPKAFWLMWTLQRACDVQCAAQALGSEQQVSILVAASATI
ncbi:class II aldolase/adducin family protein [Paraburkholderia sp. FT54]|uniref:class II aldolase/adducin family protein n=1 Tax=Paraburkholderia sp. FT54 TaxID=3074437 RepID=UPI0028778D10|nr:class II aldolase/adducin family protein [Paraburkholderia sp. FT54]WNC94245.1 class II aldolase/adducin family protein [Paraburkholderia sp. FT54]